MAGKLTKSEFEKLLQKAAERDVHTGPRNFSAEELLDAGSQLGISRDTVLEVWREHQAELAAATAVALVPRPRGTRVGLQRTRDQLSLQYGPRLGARIAGVLGVLMFGAFAVLGLRLGRPLNLAAGVVAALGIGLSLAAAFSRTRLELDRARGRLSRKLGPVGFTRRLTTEGLQVRLDQELRQQHNAGSVLVKFVALDDGTRTHKLLVNFSVPEQRWVASEIERWLQG